MHEMCGVDLAQSIGDRQTGIVTHEPEEPVMHARSLLLAAAILFAGQGCDHAGGQTGEESYGCRPVSSAPLATTASSPLGFSAADALATMGGSHTGNLHWAKGGDTALTVSIMPKGGDAAFVHWAWGGGSGGAEIEIAAVDAGACRDAVDIPVTLGFKTADGAFDEQWDATLSASSTSRGQIVLPVDVTKLTGSFHVTEVDPSQFTKIDVTLQLSVDAGVPSGSLVGIGTRVQGDTASGTPFSIATF
jgi:hypothetical protein